MKALIVLNLEDCTYEDIEEFGIDEISLDKKGGGCILWTEGFKIMPMPQKLEYKGIEDNNIDISKAIAKSSWYRFAKPNEAIEFRSFAEGYNSCIDEILGEEE